jgi:hypothetical protein
MIYVKSNIRNLDDPGSVLVPMKDLVLACKLITRETLRLEESLAEGDESLAELRSTFTFALGDLAEIVKGHALGIPSSSSPIKEASKYLTSAVFALVGTFNTMETQLVISDELLTAYENSIANVLQCVWYFESFLFVQGE